MTVITVARQMPVTQWLLPPLLGDVRSQATAAGDWHFTLPYQKMTIKVTSQVPAVTHWARLSHHTILAVDDQQPSNMDSTGWALHLS